MPTLDVIEKIEWFDDRFYKVQVAGQIYYLVSVTTFDSVVNKPMLNTWRGNVGGFNAELIFALATRQGNNVHDALERLLKGEMISQGQLSQMEYLMAYRGYQWLEELAPEISRVEYTTFNLEEQYAGTVDVLIKAKAGSYAINGSKPLMLNDGYYIVDWKTGKSVSDSNKRQMSAYYVALEKILGDELQGAMIVHLNAQTKKGIAGLSTVLLDKQACADYYVDFCAVKTLWRRLNPDAAPKAFEIPAQFKLNKDNK